MARDPDCIFCKIVAGDIPADIVTTPGVTTSGANPNDLSEHFESALEASQGAGVVAVHMSRRLSGTWSSARMREDERTVAFMDINPATRGHALVIPRAHAKDLLEIPAEDLQAVAAMAQKVAVRAKDVLDADGINLMNSCGAEAWQTLFHFHMHVIPRYADDPLSLPWVPGAGDMDEITKTGEQLKA